MSRAVQVANIARHDPIHGKILRELGPGVRPIFTRTASGFAWCELRLPESRYIATWVCCPGSTKEKALANAISAAKRKAREAA